MRTGSLNTASTMATTVTATKATFSPPATVQRSPLHSPVPYLFGGLAAMLGLIAFALVILACSYWKLSGHLENGEGGEGDLEAGEGKLGDATKALPVFEEKILVIMAGDVKPTFLATPTSSRSSSFGDGKEKSENKEGEKAEVAEKPKQEMGYLYQIKTTTTTTTTTTIIESRESQETREQNQ